MNQQSSVCVTQENMKTLSDIWSILWFNDFKNCVVPPEIPTGPYVFLYFILKRECSGKTFLNIKKNKNVKSKSQLKPLNYQFQVLYRKTKSWKIFLLLVDISVVFVWIDIALIVTCTVITQAVKSLIKLKVMFVFRMSKCQNVKMWLLFSYFFSFSNYL